MTPRPKPPDQIKTPPTSIGIHEFEGGPRRKTNEEEHGMTIERAIVICILVLLLLFIAERVL